MTGNFRQPTANVLMGRWRIIEMDLWEQADIDLVAPGFVEFGKDHRGQPRIHRRPRRDRLASSSRRWAAGRGVHVKTTAGSGDRLLEDSKRSAEMVPNAMARRARAGNQPATTSPDDCPSGSRRTRFPCASRPTGLLGTSTTWSISASAISSTTPFSTPNRSAGNG